MKKTLQKIIPMPVLLTFGPIFMVLPASTTSLIYHGITMAAAFGLGFGLIWIFKTIMRQQQEILRLGQLLASDSSEHE